MVSDVCQFLVYTIIKLICINVYVCVGVCVCVDVCVCVWVWEREREREHNKNYSNRYIVNFQSPLHMNENVWFHLLSFFRGLSRDELVSDVLLWTPTHGRAKTGRPARTYIQQLCEDTGCCLEDLPEAMNDREKWWERVRDICATRTTWWSWWPYLWKNNSDII